MKQFLLLLPFHLLPLSLCGQLDPDTLRIVDYHVHVFSERLLTNLEKQGYDMERSGFQVLEERKAAYGDIDRILKNNSQAKMLLISGGYAFDNFNTTSSEEVLEQAVQRENNMLQNLVSRYPDRLIGFYGIHPLESYSLREIKRCDEQLGLHGIKLHLQGNRVDLNDSAHVKSLKRVLELASSRNIPLLIHNNAWDLRSGAAYAKQFINTFLRKGGPLTIIFAHTGGGGAYFSFTHDLLSVFKDYLENDKSSQGHHIYFEISGTVVPGDLPGEHPMSELAKMITAIGEEKFLFGSDYPYRNSEAYLEEIMHKLDLEAGILKRIIERDIFDLLKQ